MDKEVKQKQMEISLFLTGGLTQTKTMKLKGWVNGKKVLILIDSVATHNFILAILIANMRLLVEETPPYNVCLGDIKK